MNALDTGKPKIELGYADNKKTPILSIQGISIRRFRSIKNQEVKLGEHMTILSGRNGTMKTSIIGLIAHLFDSESKDGFGKPLKTSLSEVFKLSQEFDADKYEYDVVIKTKENEYLREPVTIYYVGHKTERHRVVVSGSEKGDGTFTYNTSFLNLKRLFPLVGTNAKPDTANKIKISSDEALGIKDFYETVLPSSEYSTFIPVLTTSNLKTTFGPSGDEAKYDWASISSGEDNLGAIFNRLMGFQRSFKPKQPHGNGILCIDEFESSLHPVAQIRLFDYLYRWSQKYKVQIIISTHSLHLISHAYLKHEANLKADRVVVNFLSKSTAIDNNFPILHSPPYDLAYKELTFEDPEEVASARKIKIFCEDAIAIHVVRRLIKKQGILKAVEFHSSLNPESNHPGTAYSALVTLCTQFPLLLERSIVIFDGDVKSSITDKIKNKDLYIVLPDADKAAIERRIIAYISSLKNGDPFFIKFKKEKEGFQDSFKQAGIASLAVKDILNENKVTIESCKAWAKKDINKFKQYITYYCDKSPERETFYEHFLLAINRLNRAIGIPDIL